MIKNVSGGTAAEQIKIKRNGALPPRSGYETLRNGALGSGVTHFLMPDNDCSST